MSFNHHAIALEKYSLKVQAKRYVNLYHQILEKQGQRMFLPYSAVKIFHEILKITNQHQFKILLRLN
jgi:hypothetical protein